MKDKVMEVIERYKLIEEKDNILIGLSGGPDSMALLYVLLEIKEDIDFNVLVAHVNHGVRGKEALEDEIFVKNLAKKLNLPYYSTRVNMDEYARKHKISSEEAGRILRYGFFRKVLASVGGGKIAVAHNKNDQAETLLMRFFRGTGIDGLKGMEYISGDIIRPILGIDRQEIERYLAERNIETRLDRTNLEPIYSRNRIRLELIPYIEKYYNPNIIDALWRTSMIAAIDSHFLEEYSENTFNRLIKEKKANRLVIDGNLFLEEHRSIQQRVIRKGLFHINGDLQGITNKHISDVLTLFVEKGTGREIDLPNNIIAKTSYDDFIIEKKKEVDNSHFLYKINVEDIKGEGIIKHGFSFKLLPIDKVKTNWKDKFIKYFDYDKIIGGLYIRNRRPGDRFVPYGMKGSKKIKDYFIDEKIPKEERDRIPLITDDKNILWVVGYRSSDLYKITEDTKNVLIVQFLKYEVEEDKDGKCY